MQKSSVENSWIRIRAWYEKNVPVPPYPDFFEWGKPAAKSDIDGLRRLIGIDVPDDVVSSYLIYDGDNKQGILPGGYLMPVSEIMTTWGMFKEPAESGLFDDSDARPSGPIKQRHWNLKWIPVLHNGGGDFHCVDMDPDDGGNVGQFIKFSHETGPSHVVAKGFGEFLATFAHDLDENRFGFDLGLGYVVPITN